MGRRAKTPKAQADAKRTSPRKTPTSEAKVRDLEKRLAEALKDRAEAQEQQAATAEILRVISSPPTDIQFVFDTIIRSAVRLLGGYSGTVTRVVADQIEIAALTSVDATGDAAQRARYPQSLHSGGWHATAIRNRTPFNIADTQTDPGLPEPVRAFARVRGFRGVVVVPLLRRDEVLGAISVTRREIGGFTNDEITLLRTFADQAVIAIENVRLFNETKEAQERQTATSEILRVISSSPTDLQPVLDAVAERAARLCNAADVKIHLVNGDALRLAAQRGPIPSVDARPIIPTRHIGRAVLERQTIHVHDIRTALDQFPDAAADVLTYGPRTALATPLLRDGVAIGVIQIRRLEVKPFAEKQIALLETFADQAVLAIENVRLFTELQEKNQALTQAHAEVTKALEQQTATSEILGVISRSPTDVQPVFDAIARSSVRLCAGAFAVVASFDGELLHFVAGEHVDTEGRQALAEVYPMRPDRGQLAGRAIVDRTVIHVTDVTLDPEYRGASLGNRATLSVPMLRTGAPIGTITIARFEPVPFTEQQIALLQTFADQAVIAIENVRLFNELQARNRDLTATSEVLQVISRSPTDVQPVFDTIVRSAVRLLPGSLSAAVSLLKGDMFDLSAITSTNPAGDEAIRRLFPMALDRIPFVRQVVRNRRPDFISDVATDPRVSSELKSMARERGWRSCLWVPMLHGGISRGVISVTRENPSSFAEEEITLLQTFADQAVIAIENVRLFTELQEKNSALTTAHAQVSEALDQQTATSEILTVISRSTTDAQPVFDSIVRSAVRLCDGLFGAVNMFDGAMVQRPAAYHNYTPEALVAVQRTYPMRPSRQQLTGRAILNRTVAELPDVLNDPEYSPHIALAGGWRSGVAVPMLRDGHPIGTILVTRTQAGPFSKRQIGLLETFAAQAVIAIENVRLFKELEARTQDLTRSVAELRALDEVGQAISSTLDLQTVLRTIVARATQLSGTDAGVIYEYDESREVFVPRATERLNDEIVETMLTTPVRKGEGATGRLAEVQEPIQVPDISAAPAESRVRGALVRAGYRALLAVPLVREGHLIGGLTVIRKATGVFPPEAIELLQAFATQSSLAIQNARLFREIEDKSRQLEVASQHKSEFLANMSHELRTPLNAIIGFSEVLSDRMFGELNEKQEEYLKDIYASGTHLLSLINDILDLSKIEAGRMELELTDFDLPTALDNALTLIRDRAGRRSIALHTSIDHRLGGIQGDERKIRQVVLNLLSNAIKFTPEGGRIELAAAPKDGLVEISVGDTGVGIAAEDHEKVFEEFRQVGTAEKKAEGTGLGLTLCRKFIELHGGKIWVNSQLGQGSTFTFTIPVHQGG